MAVNRKSSEGPKGSYSRPSNAAIAKAKKNAMIKRNSAEGPKVTRHTTKYGSPRIVESGVGNIPMTIVRAGATLIKNMKSAPKSTPKPTTFRSTTKGVSKVTGGPLKNGKPVRLGPRKRTLTPAEKRAQTIAMKKARATYAAEGPKKSVASKTSKTTKTSYNKKFGVAGGVATAGLVGAAAYRANSRNTLPKGASIGNKVWNGNTWIAKKK